MTMSRTRSIRKTRTEQTFHRTERAAYEETVTGTGSQRYSEQEVFVTFNEKKCCIERHVPEETPNGSEIVPAGGPMRRAPRLPPPQLPRLSGDRIDENDA